MKKLALCAAVACLAVAGFAAMAPLPPVDDLALGQVINGAGEQQFGRNSNYRMRIKGSPILEGPVYCASTLSGSPCVFDGGVVVNSTILANGTIKAEGVLTVVSNGTDAGITTQRIEMGRITLSGGAGTFTFVPAFSSVPVCTASNTAATTAFRVHTPTTTQVEFAAGATDVLNFICIGSK